MPSDFSDQESVVQRLLGAMDRLDDRLRAVQTDLGTRFDNLPLRFMPKDELLARLDGVHADHMALAARLERGEVKHDGDIRDLRKDLETMEERRSADRKFALTALWSTAGVIAALLAILIPLLVTHWK